MYDIKMAFVPVYGDKPEYRIKVFSVIPNVGDKIDLRFSKDCEYPWTIRSRLFCPSVETLNKLDIDTLVDVILYVE
jgi:hypothetical protein